MIFFASKSVKFKQLFQFSGVVRGCKPTRLPKAPNPGSIGIERAFRETGNHNSAKSKLLYLLVTDFALFGRVFFCFALHHKVNDIIHIHLTPVSFQRLDDESRLPGVPTSNHWKFQILFDPAFCFIPPLLTVSFDRQPNKANEKLLPSYQ